VKVKGREGKLTIEFYGKGHKSGIFNSMRPSAHQAQPNETSFPHTTRLFAPLENNF
jgi:hypothetical protein